MIFTTEKTILTLILICIFSVANSFGSYHKIKEDSEEYFFSPLYFTDENQGLMIGSTSTTSFILGSSDGGKTWEVRHKTSEGLFGLNFADKLNGWIVGTNGTILNTENGGITWTSQNSGSNQKLYRISVVDKDHAFVSGAYGTILSTEDGGKIWRKLSKPMEAALPDISFSDAENGITSGFRFILLTSDGGKNWSKIEAPEWNFLTPIIYFGEDGWVSTGTVLLPIQNKQLDESKWIDLPGQGKVSSMFFLNRNLGWITKTSAAMGSITPIKGMEKLNSQGVVLKTTDGGNSWQIVKEFYSKKDHSYLIGGIFFINEMQGWMSGGDNLLMKTQDGGKNWIQQKLIFPKPVERKNKKSR